MVQKTVEKKDYYGEKGCCLTCNETLKEYMEGLQRQVYFNGKYYDCLCLEGKCSGCSWLFAGECQRKSLMQGGML